MRYQLLSPPVSAHFLPGTRLFAFDSASHLPSLPSLIPPDDVRPRLPDNNSSPLPLRHPPALTPRLCLCATSSDSSPLSLRHQLMIEAQAAFDQYAIPACPQQVPLSYDLFLEFLCPPITISGSTCIHFWRQSVRFWRDSLCFWRDSLRFWRDSLHFWRLTLETAADVAGSALGAHAPQGAPAHLRCQGRRLPGRRLRPDGRPLPRGSGRC